MKIQLNKFITFTRGIRYPGDKAIITNDNYYLRYDDFYNILKNRLNLEDGFLTLMKIIKYYKKRDDSYFKDIDIVTNLTSDKYENFWKMMKPSLEFKRNSITLSKKVL